MTDAQKRLRELRDRQSRERGRMAELAIADNLTDETRAELDTIEKGIPDLERQIRAATVAVETEETEQRTAAPVDDGDGEDRALRDLRAEVKLSGYVAAAVEQRSADGAEAEYNAARNIAGNRFPLELLAPSVEKRATTDTDTTTMPRRWLDRLFAGTAAERIGITMESVPAGVVSYPVTTAGASAAQRQRSTINGRRRRCRLVDWCHRNEAQAERRPSALQHRRCRPHPWPGECLKSRPPYGLDGGR